MKQKTTDRNRNIEIAFEVDESVYGEFKKACGLSRERPACVLKRLIQRYIISTVLTEEYKNSCGDMYADDNSELVFSAKCEVIDRAFGKHALKDRNEWLESINLF